MHSCLTPLSRWEWGGIYQIQTNTNRLQNSKLPYLEFCITNTISDTNDYNSNSPQKLELELEAHFLKFKDSNTRNTAARIFRCSSAKCCLLVMEERVLENITEKIEMQAASINTRLFPPQIPRSGSTEYNYV